MKKTYLSLAFLLASGAGYAAQACDNFQIVINNSTSEKFYATSVELSGANIQPRLIQLDGNSNATFTVNNSEDTPILKGQMVFRTFSLPSKKVNIDFELKNHTLVCEHVAHEVPNDYAITATRTPGKVTYNIG